MKNTKIIYSYRGPCGDTVEETVIVGDFIGEEGREGLYSACPRPGKFAPDHVGFPDLKERVEKKQGAVRDCWHTLVSVEATTELPTMSVSIDRLLARFFSAQAEGWCIEPSDAVSLLFPE